MTNWVYKNVPLVLGILALSGCAATPAPPAQNGGLIHQRNEGYSLLYKLIGDDSGVSDILIVKHTDDSVGSLIKEIATFCQGARKRMDEFPKRDSSIEYDESDLPYIEQKGRDLQTADDTQALLFSSGKEFEVRLIFTQAEAMNYARQLSKALAEHETDAARKSFLNDLSHRCSDFHDRLMKLLSVKS
jgi:hypothetical protein